MIFNKLYGGFIMKKAKTAVALGAFIALGLGAKVEAKLFHKLV